MDIKVIGHYTGRFGELWEQSLTGLIKEGVQGVLADAQIDQSEIEAIFVANKAGGSFNEQRHLGALVSEQFTHFPPAMRVEGACASGGLAVAAASQALMSGLYKTVLVLGVEKMTDVNTGEASAILATAASREKEYGSTFPSLYALLANYHMVRYGTTREQLSSVVVKNHRHALTNPKAQFRKEFTIEQVSQSPLVAAPLRLLDCSPISDGVAAVILSSKPSSRRTQILGFGQGQDTLALMDRQDLGQLRASTSAMQQALTRAHVKLTDIQAAEVHDCFSIAEILATEDLGFFSKGEAAAAIESGQTTTGGKIVINPSGGLKACGHPVGATGVKQVAFLSKLIEAGQFDCTAAHNVGGSGATAVVTILGEKRS
jgi:acetyl-CoA C-acetyltransferase